jgi:hypothetical protein
MPSKKCNKRHLMEAKYKRFASKMREDLFRRLKVVSAVEGKQVQQLLEEAITQYLDKYKVTEDKSEDGEVVVRFSMTSKTRNDNEDSG